MSDIVDEELIEIFLEEATDYLELWESACLDLIKTEDKTYLDNLFRVAHNLKGSSRTLGMTSFGDLVHKIEDLITDAKDDVVELDSNVAEFFLFCNHVLNDWMNKIKSDPSYSGDITEVESRIKELSSKKPNEKKVEDKKEEIVEESIIEEEKVEENNPIKEEDKVEEVVKVAVPQPQEKKTEAVNEQKKNRTSSASVRVPSERLDKLIQLIGELSISQSMANESCQRRIFDENFFKNLRFAWKVSKEIQETALSLRMNSLKSLFQRLERTAYEISRLQDKDITIEVEGSECELDKQAIEAITDPLIHIIRNAVDHGIENRKERELSGKKEKSKVIISAISSADGVAIFVKDNGKGLSIDKIRQKAIEKGIIDTNTKISDLELQQLIFNPGFSTAEKVTDISGRGVGLDVVRQKINEVGGEINIKSIFGQGTTFNIFVPLNINILDGIIVRVGREKFIVSLSEIHEIVSISENEVDKTENGNVFCRRGITLPIFELKDILNITTDEATTSAIVIKSGSQFIAFSINAVIGQHSIMVRPIMGKEKYSSFISGSTVLGDGRPGLILSVKKMARTILQRLK